MCKTFTMKIKFLFVFLIVTAKLLCAQEQQVVPYTLADRDRVIRIEAKMEALEAKMEAVEVKVDVKLEAVNSRIDSLFWMMGVLVALMIFMFGYMIWDRRTALKPALDKANEVERNHVNLINALREYARTHPDLLDILRTNGIL